MSDTASPAPSKGERWLSWGAWAFAIGTLAVAAYLGWQAWFAPARSPSPVLAADQPIPPEQAKPNNLTADEPSLSGAEESALTVGAQNVASLLEEPALNVPDAVQAIYRRVILHTIIPTRPRQEVRKYMVVAGDSVFGIARNFGLKPETILWANYDLLNDNPDYLALGMELNIPPVDGVLYQWQEGDTIEIVAGLFEAKPKDILNWPGNKLDLTDPQIEPEMLVMVPGGHREFRQWLVPTIPRGAAGVSSSLYGAGACQGSYDGAYGSGAFIWPAENHTLSGNDYWSGHLALDIAAGQGAAIYAADSGVVVFAGPALGGYGNMVMIDHGTGYQTLYAHMSQVSARCGQSVYQGQFIGLAGSTGRSTGAHLHFEVRYLGGFINPWYVLPAP